MKINKILIPLAPNQTLSDQFDQIFQLADANKATVTFFSIVEDLTAARLAKYVQQDLAQDLMNGIFNKQEQQLSAYATQLQRLYPNIEFTTEVASGTAFIEIINFSFTHGYDLIAIDANRGHKHHVAQSGSTTRHLMRKSPVPVWTTSRSKQAQIKEIVAAVDLAAPTPEGIELNTIILQNAAYLSRSLNARLHIFHAWQLPGEAYFRSWGRLKETEICCYADVEHKEREITLKNLIRHIDLEDLSLQSALIEGEPEDQLPQYIDDNAIDLLLMGTLCRTGIAGFIIGNRAESILDSVTCPVITLKPSTFKSPVIRNKH